MPTRTEALSAAGPVSSGVAIDRKDRTVTREEDLEALSTASGWTFSIEDHDDILTLPFHFFTNGVAQGVTDVIEAERGSRDVVAFDFSWGSIVGGAAEVSMTSEASCAVVALPVLCPELMVSHETTGHWLSHPTHHEVFASERRDFARAFRVTTTHPDFAAKVFSEDVERWFLRELPDHDLCFEIAGTWLMCFTRQRDPSRVPMIMDAAVAFSVRIAPQAFEGMEVPEV